MLKLGSFLFVLMCSFLVLATVQADDGKNAAADDNPFGPGQLTLAQAETTRPADEATETTRRQVTRETSEAGDFDYRGVDDFFNIREANPDVKRCQWNLDIEGGWITKSDGTDDDGYATPTIRYGVTDDMFLGLSVLPINFGDGDEQGNGDLNLIVFNRFLKETCDCPAIAGWGEVRIPSGDGSSKVDGTFHMNVTKTICPKFRAHMEGFVMTANGGRDQYDIDRRHFQWGIGPGFDYAFTENLMGVLNYLHRSSELYGNPNMNILEVGTVHKLSDAQRLKLAVDVGLDGHEETPNFAGKVQWELTW